MQSFILILNVNQKQIRINFSKILSKIFKTKTFANSVTLVCIKRQSVLSDMQIINLLSTTF